MSSLYWSQMEAIETTPALSKCQECIGPKRKQQKQHLLCLNVKFVWVPTLTNFVLALKGSSQVAEKCVALARIGHSATTRCSFLSWQKRKRRKYWRIMGNSSHVTRCFDLNLTHHYTSEVNRVHWALSVPLSGLLELTRCSLLHETKLTMLTKFDEKGYLRETYFHKQCLSLIGWIKEFKIMVAEFVSAVSSSTYFSISDRCQWKRCATNIIAYSFKYNNNKNTFLSPYNALALKIDLSSTILDAYCYC